MEESDVKIYENLTVEINSNICTIKINRPQVLNAINLKTLEEIYEVFTDIDEDEDIYVVILTGEGKAFVAGADIEYMRDLDSISAKNFSQLGTKALNAIENSKKVVIAAVNGFALGGGCEIAMACDIRIASSNAKIGQPEVTLGITPGYGGTQRLTRLAGMAKAKELIFTGQIIKADEAKKIGLVNKVVSPEDLTREVEILAEKIAKNSQLAIRYSKEAIKLGSQTDINTGLDIESSLFGLCFSTKDQEEGMSAFLEKRVAKFGK
ncbi:enoyl-CoA hydratase-related protein [Metaclostridioides mangenotii]|uniref:Enoyl-CoA hydratase n=1 Tax=Metaclostridioides mangenotii TaxID=1540 RepID=A0ABS4E7Q8_9FIRM|nr:enoyl-CoA hydratase-related protein [Clostridioides mangenotii]MBP1853972.1 enoyl-CoA hydratase [Clostridioides mangenotii]